MSPLIDKNSNVTSIMRPYCVFELTLGMIIGFITTYNNERLEEDEKEDSARMETQEDFDSF